MKEEKEGQQGKARKAERKPVALLLGMIEGKRKEGGKV